VHDVVVLDGGLSTALAERGADLDHPLWTARSLLDATSDAEHPITDAHLAFLRSGARVLITASYQASRRGLLAAGAPTTSAADAALARTTALARAAVKRWADEQLDAGPVRVGASVGPYGAVLADGSEYHGRYPIDADELREFHRERLDVLRGSRPDLLIAETLPGGFEASAVAEALDAGDGGEMPVWVSFTCADGRTTVNGDRIEDAAAAALAVPGLEALGVNCTAPAFVGELLARIATVTDLPLVAYPNRGQQWDAATNVWTDVPAVWPPGDVDAWRVAGARWVGGCCGVGPDGIGALRDVLTPDA
jgi:homocysteine S-methyltransferase